MWQALHYAALNNHEDVVNTLILQGAYIPTAANLKSDTSEGQETALHVAARAGSISAAEALVAAGHDLSIKDKDGKTAYELATAGRHWRATCLQAVGPD